VNEQAQISLLLAGPGVIATLTFAPDIIALLYANTFAAAVEPLRWICLGMALRVVAWPMGYIVLAKGARAIFFWTEVAATVVHVALAFVFVRLFGVTGATMAFTGLYIWHGFLIYVIVNRLTGFRWSAANCRTGIVFLPLIALVFVGCLVLPSWLAKVLGGTAAVASGVYAVQAICALVSVERVPTVLRRPLAWLGVAGQPFNAAPSQES
jgi:PST family polysaccharide transporter